MILPFQSGKHNPDARDYQRRGAAGDHLTLRGWAAAFDRVLIALDDADARIVAGADGLEAFAAVLGVAPSDAETLLAALSARDPRLPRAVAALRDRGAPFRLDLAVDRGRVEIMGAAAGALAFVELRRAPAAPPAVAAPQPAGEPVHGRREAALRRLLEAVDDAVAVFSADRRLDFYNTAFARVFALEPAWLAERPTHSAWLDRLRQARRLPEPADWTAFKAAELSRHERLTPAADALWRLSGDRTLRVRSLPHPDGGLVMLFTDITQALRLNGRFNQQIQVQKASLDTLTDAVAVFGADARLRLHNQAFSQLWALPAEVLGPDAAYDEIVDHALGLFSDLSFWNALKARITDLDPGVRAPARGEGRAVDGRWLAWRSRPLPDGATLISFADVSDARRLREALAEREATLEAARRLERDFVAAVSYELRAPLTTVLGYAELLDGAALALPPRQREWIASVRAASGELAATVEDIIALAEIDAGEMTLKIEPMEAADLLARAEARWRPAVEAVAARLRIEAGPVGARLRGEAVRLLRVLDHLIAHALRRVAGGGCITVAVDPAPGQTRLVVADDGPAIPFHLQATIFERTGSPEASGAGLGLALVRAVIERHGGWVALESAPGQGARFVCHLPEGGAEDGRRSSNSYEHRA